VSELVLQPGGFFVHPSAHVDAGAVIGEGTKIWHFCHVMAGARVGKGCVLGQNCFVAASVTVGDRARIQNNVSLYDGVELEDDVFCGPSVVFTNVLVPRAFISQKQDYRKTRVERGATVGANATLLPGITLGQYCFVGAGALVRRDVPAFALAVGNPAENIGWMSRCGERLEFHEDVAVCRVSGDRYRRGLDGVSLESMGNLSPSGARGVDEPLRAELPERRGT
jgi:UDP-2-acetamido-3-amino-2,3-dideoxy-glucuronate N-acetyltransferase